MMARAARRAADGVACSAGSGAGAAGSARPRRTAWRRKRRRPTASQRARRRRNGTAPDEAAPDGAAAAGHGRPGRPGGTASAADVPALAADLRAAWSWRLLLLAALLYVAARVAALLYIVIVPFAAAILLTALLQPLTARLRRRGLSARWPRDLVHPAARLRADRRRGVAGDHPGRGRVPDPGHPGASTPPRRSSPGWPDRRSTSDREPGRRSRTTW